MIRAIDWGHVPLFPHWFIFWMALMLVVLGGFIFLYWPKKDEIFRGDDNGT